MKRNLLSIVSCVLLAVALPSEAARDVENVTILQMTIGSTTGNTLFIRTSATPTGATSCHTNSHWHYTLSLDSAVGKNMYALLLSLAATGQPLSLAGLDLCNEFGGVESLRAVGVIY